MDLRLLTNLTRIGNIFSICPRRFSHGLSLTSDTLALPRSVEDSESAQVIDDDVCETGRPSSRLDYTEDVTFRSLGIDRLFTRKLRSSGIVKPTYVQIKVGRSVFFKGMQTRICGSAYAHMYGYWMCRVCVCVWSRVTCASFVYLPESSLCSTSRQWTVQDPVDYAALQVFAQEVKAPMFESPSEVGLRLQ